MFNNQETKCYVCSLQSYAMFLRFEHVFEAYEMIVISKSLTCYYFKMDARRNKLLFQYVEINEKLFLYQRIITKEKYLNIPTNKS